MVDHSGAWGTDPREEVLKPDVLSCGLCWCNDGERD